jgi:hypothetical protein
VVDMAGDNTVAAIVVEVVASVADIAVEVVHIVATVDLIHRMYVVAIVAVDSLGLVVVALSIPPINIAQTIYVYM